MYPRTFWNKVLCILFIPVCTTAFAQVSGLVYRDYNNNAIRDSSLQYVEPGVSNVQVIITGLNGGTSLTITDEFGYFHSNPIDALPYRIEFRQNKLFDFPAPVNPYQGIQQSSIQFVYTNPAQVQFGIHYPGEYCKDPQIVTPCYVMGDPLNPVSEFKDFDAFIKFDYHAGGKSANEIIQSRHGGNAPDAISLGTGSQIGSCWGVAIQRRTGKIYTSAALKRHSGIGPLSYGGLYELTMQTNSAQGLLDLNSIGVPSGAFPDNTQRDLPLIIPPVSTDSLCYSNIGKLSYGGMDITEDEKTLFIVSLHTRKLYSIFIDQPYVTPTASDVDSFAIPDPGCSNGQFRPWAVKVHRGIVYVGVVCDASLGTAADLHAYIYALNPQTKIFTQVLEFPLDYPAYTNKINWNPWLDTWNGDCPDGGNIFCQYPQPILSDIEFDQDDAMVLGLMDRYSMQGGINQHSINGDGSHTIISFGDILRARYNDNSGVFEIEQNGNDGLNETAGRNTGFGPGGGEYYFGDHALSLAGLPVERESLNGALSMCPGYQDVVSSCVDPYGGFTSGVMHLNHVTGNWDKRYTIIPRDFGLLVGKSNALGDMKIFSKAAPLEIGNYVWIDRDKDGIQDPSEPPLQGVVVDLIYQGNVIAQATTNEFGYYVFSNQDAPINNPYPSSFIYGLSSLLPQTNYTLRIAQASSQTALQNYQLSSANAGTPNNDLIDSDGVPDGMDNIVAQVLTGVSGNNDHSIDFGFCNLLPCSITISHLEVEPCNGLTSGFDLNMTLKLVNGPVGNIIIELTSGESKEVTGVANGKIDVQFKNLKANGVQNVGIRIYYVFDLNCRLDTMSVLDRPEACCPPDLNLCTNRDNLIQLFAIPGMQHYCWFDSTSRQIRGNTEVLLIDKTFPGLEDGYEAYYYYAIDATGDTIWQHCAYGVAAIECCGLTINTFLQTECNNNGTVNDSTDDWFAVLVGSDNPQAGPTGRFEVLHNGKILGTGSYGSSVLVGMAPNSDFKADGVTRYKVEIRDADNHECLDSLYTQPSLCPRPRIKVTKNLHSNTIQSDASHTIVYRIEIENQGTETGSYTLQDICGFDDDIQVLAAFYTTNIPGKAGGALLGTGPWNIIVNQLIAPGVKHTVLLTVNAKISLKPGSGGDDVYTGCGSSGPLPIHGEGLFNRALLDVNGDGIMDEADTSCTDIPYLEFIKDLSQVQQIDLKTYQLNYLVTIKNKGGAIGHYQLLDRPTFDDDITIQSASYTSNVGLQALLTKIVPVDGWILATNQDIQVGETDSFRIQIVVQLDLAPGSLGNNIYRPCGFINPAVPRFGEGLFNAAMLDLNLDLRPEKRDTVCGDLPQIMHTKTLLSKTKRPDESTDLMYLIRVENLGGATGNYNLTDIPRLEDDLVITAVNYSVNNGSSNALNTAPGNNGWLLAQNRSLAPFSVDSFIVRMNLVLDYSSGSPGDNYYQTCRRDVNGNYLAGYGIFNETNLDVNLDGTADQKDTVCTEFEFYDLALRKYEVTSTTAKNGDYIAFRIAVYNQGSLTATKIHVQDYLPEIYALDPILNPEWTAMNDTTYQYILDSLKSGDSAIIDVIVKIHAGFNDVNAVINPAEITSFESPNNNLPIDIDSTPDNNRRNDNPVKPYDPDDDKKDGHRKINPGEDEDDHDVATTIIFDLALKKVRANQLATGYHQKVDFIVWLYNQGNAPSQTITLVDYIPKGYLFHAMDNPDWTDIGNGMVTTFIPQILLPGDSLAKVITLEMLPTTDPKDWVNMAEVKQAFIVTLHHILNILQDDFDSYHDMDISNDAGGFISTPSDDHILDDGFDTNHDGITDEDDKDPAAALVWDLALKKLLVSPKPHLLGQDLEYKIWIYNQGTDTVGRVGIRDHIATGYDFVYAKNSHWKLDGNYADHIMTRRINPGDSASVSIFLKLKPVKDFADWINYAEIAGSQNLDSLNRTGQDFDSRENSDSPFERAVIPGDPKDNNIHSQDLGGDEDDHDPAAPNIFDLALCKLYHGSLPVVYGDTVMFSITVYNQGNIPAIQFSVVDYLPNGFIWLPNSGWIYDVNTHTATFTKDTLLNPGDSARYYIQLKVHDYPGGVFNLTNFAEIVRAVDFENIIYSEDLDSKYDYNKNNDPGGIPNSVSDNFVDDDGNDSDGDGIRDEDDHDPAFVFLHDLALRKEALTGNGDTAIFRIKIFNQGNVAVDSVLIGDYLNTGYQWLPSRNPGWSLQGNTASYRLNKTLLQGGIDSVDVRLFLLPTSNVAEYNNWAEILEVFDTTRMNISMLDADSKPGSDAPHERAVLPGDLNDNNIIGGGKSKNEDEDDHDVAGYGLRASLGDRVWHDRNANGMQDTNEEGIANVMVELYRADTKALVKSTKTSSTGYYLFDNLSPGNYFVKFIPPTGYTITKSNAGDDLKDSDVGSDNGIGTTPTTNLSGGEVDLSWDLGLYKCIPLYGYVFYDTNKDGIQQNAENGINGLYVSLYKLPSNTYVTRVKTFSNNTRFLHDGYYYFCVEPGEYYIKVGQLGGFVLSSPLQGTDPGRDSDLTEAYGPWTSRYLSGQSCDSLKDIGAGMYNPLLGLKVNTKDIVLYQLEPDLTDVATGSISLSAFQQQSKHWLEWKDLESCNNTYRIERMAPGESTFQLFTIYHLPDNFSEVSGCMRKVEWTETGLSGEYIYRVIAVDNGAKYIMSNEASIDYQPLVSSGFKLFPNPASEEVFILSNTLQMEAVQLNVYDELGQVVIQKIYDPKVMGTFNKIRLDVKSIQPGLYSIELKAGGINERLALTVLR